MPTVKATSNVWAVPHKGASVFRREPSVERRGGTSTQQAHARHSREEGRGGLSRLNKLSVNVLQEHGWIPGLHGSPPKLPKGRPSTPAARGVLPAFRRRERPMGYRPPERPYERGAPGKRRGRHGLGGLGRAERLEGVAQLQVADASQQPLEGHGLSQPSKLSPRQSPHPSRERPHPNSPQRAPAEVPPHRQTAPGAPHSFLQGAPAAPRDPRSQ